MPRRIISSGTGRYRSCRISTGKTLVTYVADLLYSPVLDYFSGLEKYTARRFECASVVAQAEAVRAGSRHRHPARLRGAAVPGASGASLPDVSFLRTYWLVTHADVRSLRRVEEVYSFILSRVAGQPGLFV